MKHLHFIGIEGSGASAVAAVAKEYGYKVSGCDRNLTGEYSQLFDPKTIFVEHSIEHLTGVDTVVLSPAIQIADPNNTELKAAKDLNLGILTWQQFLGVHLVEGKFVIAVCGTHGKSTTTALIAKILVDAGFDPTVVIGAKVEEWGSNFRVGKSKYVIIEADEYNNNFMAYQPDLTVVTNIDVDHLEFFKDIEHIAQSFEDFLAKTKQTVVANLVDPNVAEAVKWVMKKSGVQVFDFNKIEADFDLLIPGEFNIVNAKAAFQVGLLLGVDSNQILSSLNNFTGIGRRFEAIGQFKGIEFYSDFAHHPREIFVTLEAARQQYPQAKIWLVFQPHLYSRVKLLFEDFVDVLKKAPINGVIITDIYGSRENDPGDISSKMLVDAIGMGTVKYVPSVEEALKLIRSDEIGLGPIKSGQIESDQKSVVILMGAGDIDRIGRAFISGKSQGSRV